ncbi:MAG: RHS repeat-associated core domain-containing protein, partial [Candidatus Methylomirabilota bacterium]
APLARYAHGPGVDQPLLRLTPGTSGWQSVGYHPDGLGSLVGLTDGTGALTAWSRYDAWGNVLASSGTIPTYGYTGREPDGTGLVYYRARYYDPTLGRFTQRDPLGFADGVNHYTYTRNNPVSFTDPFGLLTDRELANIIFNETRSLRGPGVDLARYYIAQAILNGVAAVDTGRIASRPITAPTTVPRGVPVAEQRVYDTILGIAQQVETDRNAGIDPTGGALHFNFRPTDSRQPWRGIPLTTQVGPLENTYPTRELPATGIFANTYGGRAMGIDPGFNLPLEAAAGDETLISPGGRQGETNPGVTPAGGLAGAESATPTGPYTQGGSQGVFSPGKRKNP